MLDELKRPEYVHVLLNPLPVYATAMGVLALIVALFMRSRPAQIVALLIIVIGCGSAWPVIEYGEKGYDRVKSMSDGDGGKWLAEHAERAGKAEWVFYVTAALALAAIAAGWKFPKATKWLTAVTLVAAILSVRVAAWVSQAGGKVRHSEFRHEPPPAAEHEH